MIVNEDFKDEKVKITVASKLNIDDATRLSLIIDFIKHVESIADGKIKNSMIYLSGKDFTAKYDKQRFSTIMGELTANDSVFQGFKYEFSNYSKTNVKTVFKAVKKC